MSDAPKKILQPIVDPVEAESPSTPIQTHIAHLKAAGEAAFPAFMEAVFKTTQTYSPSSEDTELFLSIVQSHVSREMQLSMNGIGSLSRIEAPKDGPSPTTVACQLAYRIHEPRVWGLHPKPA